MPDLTISVSEARAAGSRVVALGIAAIVALLVVAGTVLLLTLPDANAFNARVERLFVENDLTAQAEIKLLEILAQSGTAFADTLTSYRMVIFVLLVFATAMLVAALTVLGMPVRAFGTFTQDLHDLAAWFRSCGITTVAMESTGVYWIPAFEILEEHGFEVILVNARYAKNVPGRKTDVSDAGWLRQLHSYGLLRGSFRPEAEIATLRAYMPPSVAKCPISRNIGTMVSE